MRGSVAGDQIVTRADQIVNGGINYTTQDREIMHLLLRFADRLEALQLRSDLDQLKDPSTPEPAKLTDTPIQALLSSSIASTFSKTPPPNPPYSSGM